MKLRILSLSMLAALAACNNSSDSPSTADTPGGTFDISAETAPAVAAAPDPDRDMPLEDKTFYGLKGGNSVELSQVSEAASVMHHSMKIGGEDVKFTARAGHLIAYKPAAADGASDPQAAIFYTSYTRDDLPRENRPVTFFWNGGPGASSKFLHLGSWAPKRMVINPPVIPPEYFEKDQPAFPVIDDAETLLDQSDLVFVDPVGTGFSSAIAPHKNEDFWGVDSDPKILRDFITRYINTYNRQSSPKYLYGESYSGIRTPITARLLLEAGSANYLPDPSGKPPVALSGIVLQSPVLDYNSSCTLGSKASCEGLLPTYAATADYYGLLPARGERPLEDLLVDVRAFGATSYRTVQKTIVSKITNPSGKTVQQDYLEELATPDSEYFRHLSEEAKEEKLKYYGAIAPTPVWAFMTAVDEIDSAITLPLTINKPLFPLTKLCVPSQAKEAVKNSPPLPIEIGVDISSFKREPLSGKEFVALKQAVPSAVKGEIPRTEKMVKSGAYFDYLIDQTTQKLLLGSAWKDVECPIIQAWSNYVSSTNGFKYLRDLYKYTGLGQPIKTIDSPWVRYPNMDYNIFLNKLIPGYSFNVYDARMSVPGMNYDPSFADTAGGNAAMAGLLPGFVGYINRTAPYMGMNDHVIYSWDWTPDPDVKFSTSRLRTSIPDLIESLTLQSGLKVLVLHGYTDLVTPFHQTELDLEDVGLTDRIPLKTFEGGHMTYSNEASRAPMKAVLDQFYAGTLGGPGTGSSSSPHVASQTPGSITPLAEAASGPVQPKIPQLDIDKLVAAIKEEVGALNVIDIRNIKDKEVAGDVSLLQSYAKEPALLNDPVKFNQVKSALPQVRKYFLVNRIKVIVGKFDPTRAADQAELAAIKDKKVQDDVLALHKVYVDHIKNPALLDDPVLVDRVKIILAELVSYVKAQKSQDAPPPAVVVEPESKGTQDKNKSTGPAAVANNGQPVGAPQSQAVAVPPVTVPAKPAAAAAPPNLREENTKKRDFLVVQAQKIQGIYHDLMSAPGVSAAQKEKYKSLGNASMDIERALSEINLDIDNANVFKTDESLLKEREAEAKKAQADQKAPPPAANPPVVPVSNPGTFH
ncbi:S10 family serine carboxypeptidase-like protein [Phyllobacterium sp. 22229]|uniref:S10 family serine carboxypeptidase-like protein n=1 Tax=Phyllobacterium sp. 22229 TaxID=3453895 RepID=UPI003F84B2C3